MIQRICSELLDGRSRSREEAAAGSRRIIFCSVASRFGLPTTHRVYTDLCGGKIFEMREQMGIAVEKINVGAFILPESPGELDPELFSE